MPHRLLAVTTGALTLALALPACRPAGTDQAPQQSAPPSVPAPASREPAPVTSGPLGQVAVQGASDSLTAALAERRVQGLAAMDAGRFDLARQAFAEVLDASPGNLAAQALYDAATQAMLAAQNKAGADFANRKATVVPAPPWAYALRKPAPSEARGPAPRLVLVSESRNAITDDADWLQRHGLALPEYEVPNPMRGEPGALPPTIPPTFGKQLLVQAIRQPDLNILFYGPDYAGGRFVALQRVDDAAIAGFFDFEAWEYAPGALPGEVMFVDQRAIWAAVEGGVLYISHGHNTYAKSSKGQNAYISALDASSGELLWRSAPLVANAANFVLHGGHILTGYGFTDEPDSLFVLDRATGKTVSKTKIKSGPTYLFVKDGKLFVRCYDTDYVFELRQGGG